MTTNTIKATVPVNIYTSIWTPSDIRELLATKQQRAIRFMTFGDIDDDSGYVQIGSAEVEITLFSPSQTAAAEVAALQKTLDAVRAAYLTKQAEIMERISKLQALESTVEVE